MDKIAIYYVKLENDNSFDSQLEFLKKWCENNNCNYSLFVDNVKHSMDLNNRKFLEILKYLIRKNVYSKIIIYNLKNISCNLKFNLDFISFAEEYNCKIIALNGENVYKYNKIMKNLINKLKEERER